MCVYVEEDRETMKILNTILKKLKEKSTWAGLGTLIALAGLKLDPEQFTAISTAVIGLIGAYEVFRKEK
jgi:hypothetical protein